MDLFVNPLIDSLILAIPGSLFTVNTLAESRYFSLAAIILTLGKVV